MTGAATVVVGGGVIGASAAWHLASRGVDVLVVDRASQPGLGSTGAATGGFRAQFATAINVKLSMIARAKLRRFSEEVGGDPGFVEAGYLWIAESEAEAESLRQARAVQHAEGLLEACAVGRDEIARLQPVLDVARAVSGAYCPTDGFIRPRSILEGYLRAAERLGARFRWDEEVVGFDLDGPRISRVRTSRGGVACDRVVNAAGAWAGALAALAGASLPVRPLRRQMAATVPTDVVAAAAPMTLFCGDGLHFRSRDGRVIVSSPDQRLPADPFDTRVDSAWIDAIARIKDERIPGLRGVPVDPAACWAGLYEMSPDRHAILGVAGHPENLYFVNGSSGHGVMHSPALGQLLAEIVCDGSATSLDAAALAPDRFIDGRTVAAPEIL